MVIFCVWGPVALENPRIPLNMKGLLLPCTPIRFENPIETGARITQQLPPQEINNIPPWEVRKILDSNMPYGRGIC